MDYIRRMHMKLSLFARYPAMNCRKSVARSIREVRGPGNTGIHPEFSGCDLDTYVPPSLPLPLTITLTSFRNYLHLHSIRSSPMIASVSMPRFLLFHLLLARFYCFTTLLYLLRKLFTLVWTYALDPWPSVHFPVLHHHPQRPPA